MSVSATICGYRTYTYTHATRGRLLVNPALDLPQQSNLQPYVAVGLRENSKNRVWGLGYARLTREVLFSSVHGLMMKP